MQTSPKINEHDIKMPAVSIIHRSSTFAGLQASAWGKTKKCDVFLRTAGPTMTRSSKLSLTVLPVKYSTASLDSVFPKKWRPLRPMDPGEAGVTLEPAQEHVEEASKQPSENVTDQSESMSMCMAAVSGAAGWTSTPKELFKWGLRKRAWVDFQGCETPGHLSTFIPQCSFSFRICCYSLNMSAKQLVILHRSLLMIGQLSLHPRIWDGMLGVSK